MDLQPKFVSFLSQRAPEYKYRPQNQQKIDDKKYLQMYYKNNPDDCFVQLVQTCFSDRYLYEHKSFRSKVMENKKGYVDIEQIIKECLIRNFIAQMGELCLNNEAILELIRKLSTKLICNKKQIRRKNPFVNKIRDAKPLYIEQYPQNDGNEQLQALLESVTTIYKIKYRHSENWAIVYAQNPDRIVELNGHFWSIKTYFRVMNYQKSKQTFDSPGFNSMFDSAKIYQSSIFDMRNAQSNNRSERQFDNISRRELQDITKGQFYGDYSDIDDQDIEQMQLHQFRRQKMKASQEKLIKKIKQKHKVIIDEKSSFLFPNQEFNRHYLSQLASKLQSQNSQKTKPQLSKSEQQQIDTLLMQFFQFKQSNIQKQHSTNMLKERSYQGVNTMDLE